MTKEAPRIPPGYPRKRDHGEDLGGGVWGICLLKAMRQAALGAVHAPNENMLTYQCTTLGATEVFPCLCTAVEVAAIRQGAGGWAVRARPTGDTPAPPGSLGLGFRVLGFRV